MIGLKFKLNEEKRDATSLGYKTICIVNEYLYRKRKIKNTENEEFTYYDYALEAIGYDEEMEPVFLDLNKEEFLDEIAYENYILT